MDDIVYRWRTQGFREFLGQLSRIERGFRRIHEAGMRVRGLPASIADAGARVSAMSGVSMASQYGVPRGWKPPRSEMERGYISPYETGTLFSSRGGMLGQMGGAGGAAGTGLWQRVKHGVGQLTGALQKNSFNLNGLLFRIIAMGYLLRRLLRPLKRIAALLVSQGRKTLEMRDVWRREEISAGEFFGEERSRRFIEYAWERASVSMGQAKEYMDMLRTMASTSKDIRKILTGNWRDAKTMFDKLIHTAQAMITVFPEYDLAQAVASISRAVAGQFITMARTFRTPRRMIEKEMGTKLTPGIQTMDMLYKYWGGRVSSEAIEQIGMSFKEQLRNLQRRLDIWFRSEIGRRGFYSSVTRDLYRLNQRINEMLKAEDFNNFFTELSRKFTSLWEDVTDTIKMLTIDIDISEDSLAEMVKKIAGRLSALPMAFGTATDFAGEAVEGTRGGTLLDYAASKILTHPARLPYNVFTRLYWGDPHPVSGGIKEYFGDAADVHGYWRRRFLDVTGLADEGEFYKSGRLFRMAMQNWTQGPTDLIPTEFGPRYKAVRLAQYVTPPMMTVFPFPHSLGNFLRAHHPEALVDERLGKFKIDQETYDLLEKMVFEMQEMRKDNNRWQASQDYQRNKASLD